MQNRSILAYCIHTKEAFRGVLGNRGKRVIISGDYRPNFEGSKDNIGEQGTKENKFSFLWGTSQFISGNKPVYFRETREQVHPLGGPHQISGTDSL